MQSEARLLFSDYCRKFFHDLEIAVEKGGRREIFHPARRLRFVNIDWLFMNTPGTSSCAGGREGQRRLKGARTGSRTGAQSDELFCYSLTVILCLRILSDVRDKIFLASLPSQQQFLNRGKIFDSSLRIEDVLLTASPNIYLTFPII